jgi:hypothetical protein
MDEAKLHEFMGKLVTDMGGAAMIATVILGEELGLYRAMADGIPVAPITFDTMIAEWLTDPATKPGPDDVPGCH